MSNQTPTTTHVFNADKKPVPLGPTLGEGGQGKVFPVAGKDNLLAKIYKSDQDITQKLPRLLALLNKQDPRLRQAAAWPHDPLYNEEGNVVGFTMEFLRGWVPIHKVYQVKSRLSILPESDFAFLVRVARNLATCVHFLHQNDIVIGDLNETNAFVSGNALVKLIDSDSVQIKDQEGTLFTCDVGRPEFIAPELQGKSLTNVVRTPEQDRFALAVLIFQTLSFGRHPFAGRPAGSDEITLEVAIKNRWYVYHTEGQDRLKPPPGLELRYLSPQIRTLFDRAFAGEPHQRPTAEDWFKALQKLEDGLLECKETEWHRYPPHLEHCPWCRLEDEWHIALFGAERKSLISQSEIDVERVWKQIEIVPVPQTYELPEPIELNEIEPEQIKAARLYHVTTWVIFATLAIQLTIQLIASGASNTQNSLAIGALWGISLSIITVLAIFAQKNLSGAKKDYDAALQNLKTLQDQWKTTASEGVFESTRQELNKAKDRISHLDEALQTRLKDELRSLYHYEVENYLRKYSILVADVDSASKSLLSRLHDANIKTAADIEYEVLIQQNRLSETVAKDLVRWRRALEEAFWAASPYRLSDAHLNRIEKEVVGEARLLRKRLQKGRSELESLSTDLIAHQRHLGPQIHQAHHEATEAAKKYRAWLQATGRSVPIQE